MNLAPTPLQTKKKTCVSISILRTSYFCLNCVRTRNLLCLPFMMTIFIILMAPPLAWARNSLRSDVAKVTRYKADKSKLRMGG